MSRVFGLLLLPLCACLPELHPEEVSVLVREALPNWTPACSSCLEERCAAELRDCADDRSCASFASCRWPAEVGPSPASALRCEQEHSVSDEQPGSVLRALSNCWQNSCASACALGTRWECLGDYTLPAPESSVVTVSQVLQQLNSEEPVSGATVRFCDSLVPSRECDVVFDGEGVTDAAGIATVALPILTDNRPGWSGYRRVTLPDGVVVRLQSNLAVPRSRFALQHVPNALETLVLQMVFGGQLARGNVVFQVFDCAHTSAEGVLLDISPDVAGAPIADERTQIGYLRDQGFAVRLDPDGTRSEHGGGGALLNLMPDQWVWVKATLAATGAEIARTRIHTTSGELLLLQLHPAPAAN